MLPLEEWSGNSFQSACTAVFICSLPLMVLLHGLGFGSAASAIILAAPLCGLMLRPNYQHALCDSLFIAFLAALAASTIANGIGPIKDEALLAISLAAYIAGRLGGGANRLLFVVVGAVGSIGIIVVAVALVQQWNDLHGKPLVFGEYDSAPAQVFTCFAVLVMGIVAGDLPSRTKTWAYAGIGLSFAVLAASLVRFSFFALAGALLFEAIACKRTRRAAIIAACFVLLSGAAGELARHDMAIKVAQAPITVLSSSPDAVAPVSPSVPPNSCSTINRFSSFSIRLQLLRDGITAAGGAGILGRGLGSFKSLTCLAMEPHVTILQIVIEFGWLAAGLILLTFLLSLYRVRRMERPEVRFVFMGAAYTGLITLAHGDLARDGLFFLFLGYLVRIGEEPP